MYTVKKHTFLCPTSIILLNSPLKNDYFDKARQANVGLGLKLVEWE